MPQATLIGNLNHDGRSYVKGEVFKGDQDVVDRLVALGVAEIIDEPETSQEQEEPAEEIQERPQAVVEAPKAETPKKPAKNKK